MNVAAWKLFASRIVDFKGDLGLTADPMNSDVFGLNLEISGFTQLSHLLHDFPVVPSRPGGVPRKTEQLFIKGVLVHVHGDNSVREVA